MTSRSPVAPSVGDLVAALELRYPPARAQEWDRVGLVLGEPAAEVRRVLAAVVSDRDTDPWTLHAPSGVRSLS